MKTRDISRCYLGKKKKSIINQTSIYSYLCIFNFPIICSLEWISHVQRWNQMDDERDKTPIQSRIQLMRWLFGGRAQAGFTFYLEDL